MGLWTLIRLAIVALCVWLIYRGLRSWLGGEKSFRARTRGPNSPGVIDEMVQDPQCQTYLPRQEALRAWVEGEEKYFCSEACRDAYVAQKKAERKTKNR